jgi:hypothetical protein
VNLASSAVIAAICAAFCVAICAVSCWIDVVMAYRGSTGVCGLVLDIGNSGDEVQK